FWHVIPAGGNLFKVRSGSERFTVDEGKMTCSCRMWHLSGIPCVHATKSMYSTILSLKPRKMPGRPRKKRIRAIGEGSSSTRVSKAGVLGRPRKKQSIGDVEDVDVVLRGPVRDEGAGGSRGGSSGSRGGASGSRGGASVSKGGASIYRRGVGGARVGADGSKGGAGGSKRKPVSSVGTQKRQGKKMAGASKFAKWFGLQDEPEHTQDEPQ
ncbi:multidrug resistance-associated protein 5, partial [Tanacetum coccineum]